MKICITAALVQLVSSLLSRKHFADLIMNFLTLEFLTMSISTFWFFNVNFSVLFVIVMF